MNDVQRPKKKSDIVQLATFYLAGELFGVDALYVQEILTYQEITSVPLAPDYVKGLINLRGQIVTIIDLRSRLGFDPLENGTTGMNLIVSSDEGPISLLVDQIGNVLDVYANQLKPAPGTIRGVAVQYIQAVYQLEDELLVVLDLDSVLELV
jgi:purine-binding chemotaxis protein CheW